jgi:hypothetical protein
MCLVIGADFILANLFVAGKEHVTIRDLANIRRAIEAARGGVFIDVAVNSVLCAVDQRRDMFVWDGTCVRKSGNLGLFTPEYVDEQFNCNMPPAVVDIIRQVVAANRE